MTRLYRWPLNPRSPLDPIAALNWPPSTAEKVVIDAIRSSYVAGWNAGERAHYVRGWGCVCGTVAAALGAGVAFASHLEGWL